MKKDITSCRGALDFLRQQEGELLVVDKEVDPILEVSGITKAFDNGPALLFEKVKGYPGHRILSGLFSRGERVARMFDVDDWRRLKFKGLEAIKNPLPPRKVKAALCQEVVIAEDIDVLRTLPITQYTPSDPGRLLGGGIILAGGPRDSYVVTFKRMNLRRDWGSMAFMPGGYFEELVSERRKSRGRLPLTINICPNPAVIAVAAGGLVKIALPDGTDELGIAGGIQGSPVEICPAKTVDAYSLASSEWVIEGYIDTTKVVWESEEAEQKADFSTPFFPEFSGYEGRARTTFKFQVTGITHRRDNPIFYAPMAHSFMYQYTTAFTTHAAIYDVLNRVRPGLVQDVNILQSFKWVSGLVIQVKKRWSADEEYIKNLMLAAWAACGLLRTVIVVDEDVDIYNAEELLWALNTRVDPREDLLIIPASTRLAGRKGEERGPWAAKAKMGIDATVLLEEKGLYDRGEFPRVDLGKWFTEEQISQVRAQQCEYARLLADKRV